MYVFVYVFFLIALIEFQLLKNNLSIICVLGFADVRWDDVRWEGGVCKTFIRHNLIIVFPNVLLLSSVWRNNYWFILGLYLLQSILGWLIKLKSRLFIFKLLYKPINCVFWWLKLNPSLNVWLFPAKFYIHKCTFSRKLLSFLFSRKIGLLI